VSNYFYDSATKSFPANHWWWVKWIYVYTPEINKLVTVSAIVVLLVTVFRPQMVGVRWRKGVVAWLLLAVIGIGFLVDWVLKDHVGRPHPYQTLPYNGTKDFVPVFHYQPLCDHNCSFVSGHAAGGFVWMAWGMWRGRRVRQRWLWTGVAAGALIGATRVMQGGHFLSDIIFSGWFMWLTYQLIRYAWLRYRHLRMHRHSTPMA
jgi:lipid A 4'-phosphatase